MVGDCLPVEYHGAPKVFSEKEKAAIEAFLKLVDFASEASNENSYDVGWFQKSTEWCELSEFAREAIVTFMERGLFSEEVEENLLG